MKVKGSRYSASRVSRISILSWSLIIAGLWTIWRRLDCGWFQLTSMIPKSVQRFSEKIMLKQEHGEWDDDSRKRHPGLDRGCALGPEVCLSSRFFMPPL